MAAKNAKVWYTLQEIAQLTGRSERTIRRYIKSGKIKADLIGGKYAIHKDEKERFIKLPLK